MRSLGLLMIALCMNLSAGAAEKTLELVDLSRTLDESLLEIREAKIERIESDGKGGLSVRYDASDAWPGVRFNAPQGAWRLEAFQYLTLELRNPSDEIVTVGLRVDDAETRKTNTGHLQRQIALRPGGSGALNVYLSAKAPAEKKPEFFGMRGTPFAPGYGAGGGGDSAGIDTQAVVSINVFAPKPATPGQFEILAIRAEGLSVESRKDDFYPFIDEYGQYAHKEWPRRIRSEDDFAAAIREEEADLAQNPAPASRNAYGGWDDGPKLEATGFFRPAKHEGRWWLVDPDGKLFFSHGLDCVNPAEPTPIEERASWFCLLPDRAGIFGAFYGTGRAQRFYFAGRNVETYDFGSANLMRKYGSSWQETHADLAHRRLASWGFNTIGNWSDEGIYLLQRTPYVVAIHAPSPVIQSDTGHWKTFPDVFDPGFEAAHRQRMEAERGKSAGDPWCIGYFVGNELPWNNMEAMAQLVLAAPSEQAAKKEFLADLKAKYQSIEKLNAAWQTEHASWDALAESRQPPDRAQAQGDLQSFGARIADRFFQVCREAVKAVAPNNLYLGCRFSSSNPTVAEAAARHCDVVSYNLYRTPDQLDIWQPDFEADAPVIIGEWHFGALDRGLFHTGLRGTQSQEDRAKAYEDYVNIALSKPWFVGCHWFKYKDQMATGRTLDGENYQIGFVDICDTPYHETIAASRNVGAAMYELRSGAK